MNRLKFLLATFVVAVLTLGIYSCQKENLNLKRSDNFETRTASLDINNSIYDYHYQGLLFAHQKITLIPKPSINSIVKEFNSSYSNYLNLLVDKSIFENTVANKANLNEIATNKVNYLNNISGITTTKLNKINELKNSIFSIELNPSYRNSILSKINSETDNEIRSGYELLLSSYDYWITEITDNDDDVQAIQLDAAGYIIGWVSAVIEDYEAGNLNPEGQWRRIRIGAYTGLACSVGKWF